MTRSRQLFLRSRLELAAELEQNAPRIPREAKSKREVVYFFSLLFINLPFAFIYVPIYVFLYLTYGQAAADRYMPDALLKTAVPSENGGGDDGDEWEGRVLDMNKRTKMEIKPVREDMKQMQTKMEMMDENMKELHEKVDRMQAENKQMQAESEARMKQM